MTSIPRNSKNGLEAKLIRLPTSGRHSLAKNSCLKSNAASTLLWCRLKNIKKYWTKTLSYFAIQNSWPRQAVLPETLSSLFPPRSRIWKISVIEKASLPLISVKDDLLEAGAGTVLLLLLFITTHTMGRNLYFFKTNTLIWLWASNITEAQTKQKLIQDSSYQKKGTAKGATLKKEVQSTKILLPNPKLC